MRTLAGTCATATMSQEGVEVGDGSAGPGAGNRRWGGAGIAEGASQFLGTPSEAQTFPLAGARSPGGGE